MFHNNLCYNNKEKQKEDSLIINEDLFEQKNLESDDEQIILNEQDDEGFSFLSNESENKNKFNKIQESNFINNNINNIEKSKGVKIDYESNIFDDNLINSYDIMNKISDEINIEFNNQNEIENTKKKTPIKNKKENKKYFTKKVLYKKENRSNNISDNKKPKNQKLNNKEEEESINNIDKKEKKDTKSSQNIQKNNLIVKRQKSKKNYIDKMKEKKNIKINYNNHPKIFNKNSRNDDETNSCITKEKNNILTGTEYNYDKYGNKTVIKKKEEKTKLNQNKIDNNSHQKLIKLEKKLNKSYDSVIKIKRKNNSPKFSNNGISFNSKPSKSSNKKKNYTNNNTPIYKSRNESQSSFDIKKSSENKQHTHKLKKILINKINNQINEIIRGKEKLFLNENNNLYFLGFCDLLFEIGFVHIKETEIKDISKIKSHIKKLYTQPFTNRALLSEIFLYNEQNLLICAWKTILSNFSLIKEFHSLPEEKEEISLDDCKLFIFIVTGLFIGYNNKTNKIYTDTKNSKNKININTDEDNKNKNGSKYHFRRKSEKSGGESSSRLDDTSERNGNKIINENILMNILKNRQKTDYDYKIILNIKNFFSYFAELRKLYNLYQKEIKIINKKISLDKDLTFQPKTNKSENKILLSKFSKEMDFFQRNDVIKKRNEKKIVILQRERSKNLLKECTFEPCQQKKDKSNKKNSHLNPKEISNRLFHNFPSKNRFHKSSQNLYENNNLNNIELSNENNSQKIYLKSNYDINPKIICDRGEKIFKEKKSKEIYNFKPSINKKLNRDMFSKSPLNNDDLVNQRIKDLRDANLFRFIHNYEKNNREIISNDIKSDKNLLKEYILSEKKGMKLDMEKKTNKDTFDNFINLYDLPDLDYDKYDIYNYNNMHLNEPLFTVEIKIKENIKTLEVYKEDIPEKLAYDFCVENSLGKGSYEKILNIIQNKLDEIYNGYYNDEIYNKDNNNVINNANINDINEQKVEKKESFDIIKDENINEKNSLHFNDDIEKEPDINDECNNNEDINIDNFNNNIIEEEDEKEENNIDVNNEEKRPDINNCDIEDSNKIISEENYINKENKEENNSEELSS